MKYTRVHIDSFGYELPPHVVTSDDLEERLKPLYDALRLQKGQLEAITGIRERRFWDPGFPMHAGAARAGRKALEAAGIDRRRTSACWSTAASAATTWSRPPPARWPTGSAWSAATPDLRRLQRLPRGPQRHGAGRQRHRTGPDPGRPGGFLRVGPPDRRPDHRRGCNRERDMDVLARPSPR